MLGYSGGRMIDRSIGRRADSRVGKVHEVGLSIYGVRPMAPGRHATPLVKQYAEIIAAGDKKLAISI